MTTPAPAVPTLPWWRVKMVWLVIAGPAAVVLAGVLTTVIAFQGADPVVRAPAAAEAHNTQELAVVPAHQARNHAATVAAGER